MTVARWVRRLGQLLGRGRVEREMDEELRFHLEMEAGARVREGTDPRDARRQALMSFGGVERFKEAGRDSRGTRRLEDLVQDVRHGARLLGRSPGFALVAVLTLALGIGANTAIFSVVNAVLLRPLPYPRADRLVRVTGGSEVEFVETREAAAFESLAAYTYTESFGVSGDGEPERVTGSRASPDLLRVLRVEPLLGRWFTAAEERVGQEPVVVLGHALWRQRYGGDPGVLGRSITVDGSERTVVGVMPPSFAFPDPDSRLWLPLVPSPQIAGAYWGAYYLRLVGRLSAGATPEVARAEVRSIYERLRVDNPVWTPGPDYVDVADVTPLREHLVRDVKPLLLVLLGAVALVLLIACVNVANLLLARSVARDREMAVRAALGAPRGRLLRQALAESLLLAALGGAAGLVLAVVLVRVLSSAVPADIPRVETVAVDGVVLFFTAAVALTTGLIFGLLPALRVSGDAPHGALREGGRGGSGSVRQRRVAGTLVAAEIALSVLLVIGATLLTRSFLRLRDVDPGFRPTELVTARITPPASRYADAERQRVFYGELLSRVANLPGVEIAAATSHLPFGAAVFPGIAMWIDGYTTDPNDLTILESQQVTPSYFDAMGITFVRGRGFSDADGPDAPGVAIIDETAARRYWAGRDPIGGRIQYPWSSDWLTVVGVVRSVRTTDLSAEGEGAFYIPFAQRPVPMIRSGSSASMTLVLRTRTPPAGLASALRAAVAEIDPGTPVSDVRPMQQLLSASVGEPRFAAVLLLLFAGIAMTLGAVGIYGVIAYAVGQRRREIGVRMALGARRGTVLATVIRQGALLALAGIAVGLIASLGLTRLLRGLLYGVSPTDPLTFALVAALLAAVALIASWLPSRRAARTDPMRVLRDE